MIFGSLPKLGDFDSCVTQEGLASALGTTYQKLDFHLYSKRAPKYRYFGIPKASGGVRAISVPPPLIKHWQSQLAIYLANVYVPKPSVHGFVRGRSIVTGADVHVKQRLILNIDIKDFFPCIHYGRVRGIFSKHPFAFSHEVASTLAQLCTVKQVLPQGAPTSPVLANLACRGLDNELWKFAKKYGCRYTRYADDITLSTRSDPFPPSVVEKYEPLWGTVELGKGLQEIFLKHQFEINYAKVRMGTSARRQEVTGLLVNKRVNVHRTYVRSLRALLMDWKKDAKAAEKRLLALDATRVTRYGPSPTIGQHVAGKLEFLRMVRGVGDPVHAKYAIAAAKLSADMRAPALRGKSAQILAFLKETLWIVEARDPNGISVCQGTAFVLKGVGFVSAAHVFREVGQQKLKWRLIQGCAPYDEFAVTCYKNHPAIDMTVIISLARASATLERSALVCANGDEVTLLGFPSWNTTADQPLKVQTPIVQTKVVSGISSAAVQYGIKSGASGGPVLDSFGLVVGVIVKSIKDDLLPSSFISIRHIDQVMSANDIVL